MSALLIDLTMSERSISDQIKHYQKDIERCPENSERMMRCLKRLFVLPVKVIHLQETGIGRSVNGLRKYPGEVGDTATSLVAKWKSMVAAEDSECEQEVEEEEEMVNEEPVIEPRVCNGTEKTPEILSRDKENIRVNHSDKSKHHSKHHSRDKERKDDKHSSSRHKSSEKHKDRDRDDKKDEHNKSRNHSKQEDKKVSKSSSSDSHNKTSTSQKPDKAKSHEKDKHSRHKDRKEERRKESSKEKEKVKLKVEPESDDDRRPEKRKSISKSEVPSKRSKFIKEESSSESDDERLAGSNDARSSSSEAEPSESGSDDDSPRPVRIKQEPSSNSDSDSDHHNKSSKHSSLASKHSHKKELKKPKDSPKDLKTLIAENEKKIKKEKLDKSPEKRHRSSSEKSKAADKIKMERNYDGSIDNCSGASFGDALLGLNSKSGKKKKKSSGSVRSTSESRPSSSAHSSPAHSSSSSPSKTLDLLREPDALSKRVKLEALPLDISSTLPEISTNYRPLPQPQIPARRLSRSNNEEEAMYSIMTTKNQRTKVFSGNKSIYHTSVPSLYNCCIQVLYENIDGLEYTGGVPYDILKPLLSKLTADQLLQLEHYNPYLVEETDLLWNFHCKKDFRSSSKDQEDSWRDLYLKCTDERERKLKRLTANISESMAKSAPVRQAKLAYVDSVVKPPRNVARKQAKYGTGGSSSSSSSTKPSTSSSSASASSSSSQASKREIVSKAIVGGFTPTTPATDVVSFNNPATASKILKKKKAPLMAKALQLIKSNSRYKR